jgi:DNA-binding transcriptional MerR regulator
LFLSHCDLSLSIQYVTNMTNRNRPNTTPLEDIPKKIYYSISEASEFTGVEPHVLRYWETKFSKLNPKRVGGNQRKYTRNDIELLYEIVNLLYSEGYTLDGAERKLKGGLQALRAERENEKDKEKDNKDKEKSTPIHDRDEEILPPPVVEECEDEEYDLFNLAEQEEMENEPAPVPVPVSPSTPTLASFKKELQDLLTLLND